MPRGFSSRTSRSSRRCSRSACTRSPGRSCARRPLRSLVAFVGAQPALLYGYAFWSGIKEMTVAYLIALTAALAAATLSRGWQLRGQLALAVAAGRGIRLPERARRGLACRPRPVRGAACRPARRSGARRFRLRSLPPSGCCLRRPRSRRRGGSCAARTHPTPGTARSAICSIRSAGFSCSASGRPEISAAARPRSPSPTCCSRWWSRRRRSRWCTAVRRRVWGLPLYVTAGVVGWVCVALFDAAGHGSPWLDGEGTRVGVALPAHRGARGRCASRR